MLIEQNETTKGLVGNWLLAIFVLAFCGYPLYMAIPGPGRGETSLWIFLVSAFFALIGVWLLWRALRQTIEYLNAGRMRLRLKKPARTGDTLSGAVEFDHAPPGLRQLHCDLVCVRSEIPKDDRNSSVTAAWSGAGTTAMLQAGARSEASVEVRIPAFLPGTQSFPHVMESDLEFAWELIVTNADASPAIRGSFTVPVEATTAFSRADAAGIVPGPLYDSEWQPGRKI